LSASVDVLGYVGRVRGYEGGYNQLPAVLLPGSEQSTVNLWILWLPILFELVLLPSVPVIPATVPDILFAPHLGEKVGAHDDERADEP
jgi:hypothetical protein